MNKKYYDIVIVGGGGAGLRAALEVVQNSKLSCVVISKTHPIRSQTCMAQGGMNAALSSDDSFEKHAKDTVVGGDFLSDQDAVEFFTEKAPERVIELERMGMIFSRTEDGEIAQRHLGGTAQARTCFARDFTGRMLLSTLYTETLKHKIPFLEEHFLNSLIVEKGICKGVIVTDMSDGETFEIHSKTVILATGGAANIYQNTVNAVTTTGDGMAAAYRAGAALKDMEFVQFHPTSLGNKGILITEGCRGEGGHLINSKGERFMKFYAPKKMELASRDVVSRAIQAEIKADRDINGCVLLDLTHLGEKKIKEQLPQVHQIVLEYEGIDCTKQPIPVKPSAHYFMGGIDVNIKCETEIKGLYAAGECSCISIHGANRLGGNSIMDIVVFGKEAGGNAVKYTKECPEEIIENEDKKETTNEIEKIETILKRKEGTLYSKIKYDMQKLLEENLGMARTKASLHKAEEKIKELKQRYSKVIIKNSDKKFNFALYEAIELENMLEVAHASILSAKNREESRGAHYRKDFSIRDDRKFLKHSIVHLKKDDAINVMSPVLTYKDVIITKYNPGDEKKI